MPARTAYGVHASDLRPLADEELAMTRRAARRIAVLCAVFCACASLFGATAPAAVADVTTHTPVMGPNILNANQLAAWYNHYHAGQARIPSLNNNVAALAQIFLDEGKAEGVRGDIAFAQSMLETGWLTFSHSQIPPDAYNYAGMYAFDGRQSLPDCSHGDSSPSRCMGTPQHGVLMQIQLLRSYADPSTAHMSGRLISAPSDRVGAAPIWEYFGGHNCPCGKLIWASADNYGLIIVQLFDDALGRNGLAGACVPYAPGGGSGNVGTGYWEVTQDGVVHPFGSAGADGDTSHMALAAPLIGGESLSTATGYWLLGRDGGIFSFGHAHFWGSEGGKRLNGPVNGMERTWDNKGYWLVADDGGVFTFGDARFFGSKGGQLLNQPVVGMERTNTGNGYFLFARDGGVFTYGDAHFVGSLGSTPPSSPVVAMQRTPVKYGYWMMTADGRVFKFGNAAYYGDIAGCGIYGNATRLLVTPDGKGYWIATDSGAVIPFGDAKKFGFPTNVGGPAVALMGVNNN